MKLKTLKDIELSNNYNQEENKKELREEAIKWIKRNRMQDMEAGKKGEGMDVHIYFVGAEQWIKHFFNITEDDLKGGNLK